MHRYETLRRPPACCGYAATSPGRRPHLHRSPDAGRVRRHHRLVFGMRFPAFNDVAVKLSRGRPPRQRRDLGHPRRRSKRPSTGWASYRINPGEGYGPKLEFVLRDAIGRDAAITAPCRWTSTCRTFDIHYARRHGGTSAIHFIGHCSGSGRFTSVSSGAGSPCGWAGIRPHAAVAEPSARSNYCGAPASRASGPASITQQEGRLVATHLTGALLIIVSGEKPRGRSRCATAPARISATPPGQKPSSSSATEACARSVAPQRAQTRP